MKIKEMMYVSLFTSFVIVLSYVPGIPLPFSPVPITAQTFGVMLAGAVLGARLGGLSMLVFVILAAIGAPVLSGGAVGLLRPSGGFVLSWPVAAYLIGFLVERSWDKLNIWKIFIFNILGGIIIVYLVGVPYLAALTDFNVIQALITTSVYIPGDLIKAFVAAIIALQLHKSYPLIGR